MQPNFEDSHIFNTIKSVRSINLSLKYLRFHPSGCNDIETRKFEFAAKIQFLFVTLSIHKPSLGSCEVPHKIWTRSVQPFWRLSGAEPGGGVRGPKTPLFLETNLKVYCNLFSSRYKTNFLVKSADSLQGKKRIFKFLNV